MSSPQVSVVLPVYNGEKYLIASIASILEQTERDFELIAINDGSSDSSGQMLDWFAAIDSRIQVIHQENCGLVASLNRGCAASRGDFIMRMDNDDVAFPGRLEAQLSYMRAHPECVVCGTSILEIDDESDPLRDASLPSDHDGIVANLLNRRTGHFHPSVLMKREALQRAGGYRPEFEWVEDHDLWLRMSQQGELANLTDVLLCYRQHSSSICWQRSSLQRKLMNQLLQDAYESLGRQIPEGLILNEAAKRSPAGPGKWARAAARGGYRQTALKHLRALQKGPEVFAYRTRMSVEVLTRVAMAAVSTSLQGTRLYEVPQFDTWHDRWVKAEKSVSKSAA